MNEAHLLATSCSCVKLLMLQAQIFRGRINSVPTNVAQRWFLLFLLLGRSLQLPSITGPTEALGGNHPIFLWRFVSYLEPFSLFQTSSASFTLT